VCRQQRAENRDQILCGVGHAHRLCQPPQRGIEKFLHDLVADDSFPGIDCSASPLSRFLCFGRRTAIEGVDENVGVEEESHAHSSHPGCQGLRSERAAIVA